MNKNSCIFFLLLLIITKLHCPYGFDGHDTKQQDLQFLQGKNTKTVPEDTVFKGCEPSKIWIIIKHGIKTPNVKDIFLIGKRLPKLRNLILKHNPNPSVLTQSDLEELRNWENKLSIQDYYRLPHESEVELIHIAERMQARFPSLLGDNYNNESYKFKYPDSKRNAHFFTVGLFGKENVSNDWYNDTSGVDPMIQFHKLCRDWSKGENDFIEEEPSRKPFNNRTLLAKLISQINDRLHLPLNTLSFEDIHLMHLSCLYETAANTSTKSPWCSVFSTHNLKLLNYLEDIKYYSDHGYTKNMNNRLACVAFDDLITFFKSDEPYPKTTIFFTHSGTILKVLLLIKQYKEEDVPRRTIAVSHLNTFETNLAFILYDCKGVSKVLTMYNEHIVRLPSCPHKNLCELSKISVYYKDICNFKELCNHKNRIGNNTKDFEHLDTSDTEENKSRYSANIFHLLNIFVLIIIYLL